MNDEVEPLFPVPPCVSIPARRLPIPRYVAKDKTRAALARAAAKADKIAAAVALPEGVKFQRARKLVRETLTESVVGQDIDALVAKLLDS